MNDEYSYWYRVYSIPMCQSLYEYEFNSEKMCLSTSNEICPMENICQLNLGFLLNWNRNVFSSMNFLFPHVRKLHLYFRGELAVDFDKYLLKTIDVCQLIEMKFDSECFHGGDEDFLSKLLIVLNESPILSSLIVHIRANEDEIYPHLETLIQYLPRQINC